MSSTLPPHRRRCGKASCRRSRTASSSRALSFRRTLNLAGLAWVGVGPDGKPVTYVRGKVLRFEPPRVFQYTFEMGQNNKASRATIELVPETEATKVTVTHDEWAEDDPTYVSCSDGWPRILSRLKTLLETGKTFKPH